MTWLFSNITTKLLPVMFVNVNEIVYYFIFASSSRLMDRSPDTGSYFSSGTDTNPPPFPDPLKL